MSSDPLDTVAPSGETVFDYDRRHLLTYAELLDAEKDGVAWQDGSLEILGIDPTTDAMRAQTCWDTHLARARWITGDGLRSAITAFGEQARAASRRRRQREK
ncbi:hypothetical protein [Novosphingobium album (ex Liu et al. 2023)]|uniref:DUF2285 domain-containing protein n=1 Tax=Novosphingobium album (ex Liu et al. 2023) TaxID=3031130 RepID=A0ABT5WQZ4_9SPHN|nr:hypothetical protein [Novosphingobium album (ex Liu et al. 2023)]MDE8652463.1 hypothetical protein [Novosphingobium album (ex Liu et al. 2023)]